MNGEGVLGRKVAVVTGTSRGVGVGIDIGIAHELLRAGATVVGCSRSTLDAIHGADHDEARLRRCAQMVCDQGDLHADSREPTPRRDFGVVCCAERNSTRRSR